MTERPPLFASNVTPDPLLSKVTEIVNTTYSATSAKGHVTAVAGGDQLLRSVQINRPSARPGDVGRAILQAANAALSRARLDSVTRMKDLPILEEPSQSGQSPHSMTKGGYGDL